jgi:signal transduction histidine kinase
MQLPGSGNFLLRPYLFIVLGIVLIAFLLDSLLATRSRDNFETDLKATHAPLFFLLGSSLADMELDVARQWLQQQTNDWSFPVQIFRLGDFAGDPQLHDELQSGSIMVFANSDSAAVLYQRINASDHVLLLGPMPQTLHGTLFETLVITAYYALVALLVLIWIRPFYRDLALLRQAAAKFGNANFATRVKLSGKSSILPVAQSFNTMAERIEYLVQAHKELTHAVSHELRTPLARFRFSLEILARNHDPSRMQHYLDNMKGDVTELESLIDELLSYARLSEDNLLTNLVDMDLRNWLQEELKVYVGESINITCSFSADSPAASYRASFNPDLMARALHNILRNGLRYARNSIAVHVHKTEAVTQIRICDDGPGIPEHMHEKIFEPFARIETSRDKKSGGYGLGLAIAARILQRHNGSIHVTNCEPDGACFVLEWPG